MASVIIISNLKLEPDKKKAVIRDIGDAVTVKVGVEAKYRSIMWQALSDGDFHEHQKDILNLFVYLPPKPVDYKRDMGAKVQAALDEHFSRDSVDTVIIFKEHRDENVYKNGVLRWDETNAGKG
jgi:hypothetical protein